MEERENSLRIRMRKCIRKLFEVQDGFGEWGKIARGHLEIREIQFVPAQ